MRGAGRGAGEARGEARVRGARMGAGRGAVRSWAHTAVDESMQVFILRIVVFHARYLEGIPVCVGASFWRRPGDAPWLECWRDIHRAAAP